MRIALVTHTSSG